MLSIYDKNYINNCPASSKEFNSINDAKIKTFCNKGCSVKCTEEFKKLIEKKVR